MIRSRRSLTLRAKLKLSLSHAVPGRSDQALSALLFHFERVLGKDLGEMRPRRAKAGKRLPVVLAVGEVRSVLNAVPNGTPAAVVGLLYGCGLRVSEALRSRVKDVDFANSVIWIRDGKGEKDCCPSLVAT